MHNIKKLNRVCENCKSKEAFIIYHQKFILEDENPLPDNYDIVSCKQCGFVFADVDATQEMYNSYYNSFSKYENIEISSGSGHCAFDYKRLKDTADYLVKFTPDKESRVLDIGAGLGGQLNIFKKNGYENLYALEPSKACVEHMLKNGINAYCGSIFDNLKEIFSNEKFDLVIISHVMEHIYDLNKAIENIKDIVTEDTKIYIEVPNANEYYKYFFKPYYYFDIEHINHFSSKSLSALLSNHGYEPIESSEIFIVLDSNMKYPVFYTVFERVDTTLKSIESFIKDSENSDIEIKINNLVDTQEEIVVWGAGNYTKRLLAQTKLNKCNILYFVDKDRAKNNTKIVGYDIGDITSLAGYGGTILVISAIYSEDIVLEIKKLGYINKIEVL